jgi:hypothetical protein
VTYFHAHLVTIYLAVALVLESGATIYWRRRAKAAEDCQFRYTLSRIRRERGVK